MKTVVLFLVAFLVVNFTNSQENEPQLMAFNSEDIPNYSIKKSNKSLNAEYIHNVLENSMAVHVSALEKQVVDFDVTNVSEFKGKTNPFKVKFKSNKGYIEVVYDNNGKIIESNELFKEVKLPNSVRDAIFTKYPNYSLSDTKYLVHYKEGIAEKVYQVTIRNKASNKKVKLNSKGEFL